MSGTIDEVVSKINGLISVVFETCPSLHHARFFGLAIPVTRSNKDYEVFPAVVDSYGDGTDVFVDDDFPVGIYHRLLSKQYAPPVQKKQYGDDTVQMVYADMILICWAFRNRIYMSADVLESAIYSCFPKDTTVVSSNFDSRSVFAGEFSGIPFNIPENVALFSVKYKYAYPVSSRECTDIKNFCKQ